MKLVYKLDDSELLEVPLEFSKVGQWVHDTIENALFSSLPFMTGVLVNGNLHEDGWIERGAWLASRSANPLTDESLRYFATAIVDLIEKVTVLYAHSSTGVPFYCEMQIHRNSTLPDFNGVSVQFSIPPINPSPELLRLKKRQEERLGRLQYS